MRRSFLKYKPPTASNPATSDNFQVGSAPRPSESNPPQSKIEIPTGYPAPESVTKPMPPLAKLAYLRMVALPRGNHKPQVMSLLYPGGVEAIVAHPGFPASVIPMPSPLRFTIHHTADKGTGVFASADLRPGDLIMSERPLLLGPMIQPLQEGRDPDTYIALCRNCMEPERRRQFDSLYNCKKPSEASPLLGIVHTNAFSVSMPGCEGKYLAVCAHASRFNHSCSPNAIMLWRFESFCQTAYALRPIRAGEEMTISYLDESAGPRRERQAELFRKYSFECNCQVCSLPVQASRESDKIRGYLGILESNAKKEKDWDRMVRQCTADGRLPGEEGLKQLLGMAAMMDREGYYPPYLSMKLYQALCKLCCVKEQMEEARSWARKAAVMTTVLTGGDGGWGKVIDTPEETTWWGRRTETFSN